MEVKTSKSVGPEFKCDALIIPVGQNSYGFTVSETVAQMDDAMGGGLVALARDAKLSGAPGSTFIAPTLGKLGATRIVLTGLGSAEEPSEETVRKAWGAAITAARSAGAQNLASYSPPSLQAAVAGAELADYRFDRYFGSAHEEAKSSISTLTFLTEKGAESEIAKGKAYASAVSLARDLYNEPGMTLTPEEFASRAKKVAKDAGLEIEVFDVPKLKKLGANAILTVGAGSVHPPVMIHLTYKPKGKKKSGNKPVGLIGKCITFDTGGYSLKPHEVMIGMQGDMAGGAAVLGAMSALAALDCQKEVHGVICAAENMISGEAFRTGDIITGMNGVTMEIHSTDAEGRLVLADGLVYMSRLGVAEMIDLATLTGAKVVALGDRTIGLFANDDQLAVDLESAASVAGEPIWRLPLSEHLHDQIKGEIGDLKNTGGRAGGAITAALFLEHFSEGHPWAHLDIAGGGHTNKPGGYQPKGATGIGVRTLLEYLLG